MTVTCDEHRHGLALALQLLTDAFAGAEAERAAGGDGLLDHELVFTFETAVAPDQGVALMAGMTNLCIGLMVRLAQADDVTPHDYLERLTSDALLGDVFGNTDLHDGTLS